MGTETLGGGGTTNISGQPVTVSGNIVNIASGTGPILTTAISGEALRLSGINVVTTGGTTSGVGVLVQTQSGSLVNVTGTVTLLSGNFVIVQSGYGVLISGQTVQLQSGTGVIIQAGSGEPLRLSGTNIILQSGSFVIVQSGYGVLISGQTVIAKTSGEVAKISGETISITSGQQVILGISKPLTSPSPMSGLVITKSGLATIVNAPTTGQIVQTANISTQIYQYMGVTLAATQTSGAIASPVATVEMITSVDGTNYDLISGYSPVILAIPVAPTGASTPLQVTSNLVDIRGINNLKLVVTNKDYSANLIFVKLDTILVQE